MTRFENIYPGHDNVIDLLLTTDDVATDISDTTRATALFDTTLIDSDTSLSVFDWSDGENGILHLTFGAETIPIGSYNVIITLYDAINTDGIVWDSFKCRVNGEEAIPVPVTPPPLPIAQGGTGQDNALMAFNALKQYATETYSGVVELATPEECAAGVDTLRAVTPEGLFSLNPPPNILYVAKNGSDTTGNGSINNPFLTIEHANNHAIANLPVWPGRIVVSIAPGIYTEHFTDSFYRVWMVGTGHSITENNNPVMIRNTGADAAHHILPQGGNGFNFIGVDFDTTDADIEPIDGEYGTLQDSSSFSGCHFHNGHFVNDLVSTDDIYSVYTDCYFTYGDGFQIEGNTAAHRSIVLKNCSIDETTDCKFAATGGDHSIKIDNCYINAPVEVNGTYNLQLLWSEMYDGAKLTFDTDGSIDMYSTVIDGGVHFYSDTPETKKCVNCLFQNTPVGEGDMTADTSIEFIEYSGNHQHNGIDGEIITVSKIKNVAGGQNMYRDIHEALKGSTLTDTIINLEGDVAITEPLVINPNIDIQIDGNKKWKLSTTHATTLCDVGENQHLAFVNLKQISGGKKVGISAAGASASFVSCGRYTDPCYVNMEINTCDDTSFVYCVKSTIIGTTAPAILSNCTHAAILLDRSHIEGALNYPGITFTAEADDRMKCKNTTLIHGGGTATVPMTNTSGSKVTVAVYGTAMNANFPTANFTNSIANASNVVDSGIVF